MSYIGNTNTTQAFTPAVDFFNGNGSTTAFTLSKPVASVAQVQAVISNVPQNPGSAYTVSGNTITFTSAPPSGTSNIYVYYTSPITQVIAPGQGTVGTAQLQDGAVITQDIADGAVTPAKLSTGAPTWTSAGNMGLGVTPSAFGGGYKGFEIGAVGNALTSASTVVNLSTNAIRGSSWTYGATGRAVLYQQDTGSGTHAWYNAASGTAGNAITFTQAMTLDANGKLLVGGTTSAGGGLVQSRSTNATTVSNTYVWSNQDTGAFLWNQSDTTNSAIGLTMWGGSSGNSEAAILMVQETANSLGALAFYTGGYGRSSTVPERARIDSSGNLLVGRTNTTVNTSNFGIVFSYDGYINCSRNVNGTSAVFQAYGNAGEFRVYGNGTYATISDARIKENIVDTTPKLQDLMNVRIVNYNIIGDDQKQLGVIAQELAQVFPSLVDNGESEEDTKAVRYSVFVPMLIKALQEQQAIIETLTQRITALESK